MLTDSKKYYAAMKKTIECNSSSKQIDSIANQFNYLDQQIMPTAFSKKSGSIESQEMRA